VNNVQYKTKCKQTLSTQTKLELKDNSIQLAIRYGVIYRDRVSVWLKITAFLNKTLNYQLFPHYINPLTPNDLYISRTTTLTSKRYILYTYSTNVGTEYFKRAL